MIVASITIAIICIVIAIRCMYIDWILKRCVDDYDALKQTEMKFSATTKLFQQQFPKSAKKNKRHG